MGCMSLLGMALAGALAVVAALAPSSLAAKNDDPAKLTDQRQVRKLAGAGHEIRKGPGSSNTSTESGGHSNLKGPGVQKNPKEPGNQSNPEGSPQGNDGGAGGAGANNSHTTEDEAQPQDSLPGAGGTAGSGGTAGPHTCEHPKTSITIRLLDEGSSVQFACKSGFTLYPEQANKVFSKDCKKQETLKDMTRSEESPTPSPPVPGTPESSGGKDGPSTQASATTSRAGTGTMGQTAATQQLVYTLRADKKPSKKKLCYLCAQQGVSEQKPGTAQDYCTIYVESGAHTQLGRGLAFALMLLCVLAVL